jgi:hypothetical protein
MSAIKSEKMTTRPPDQWDLKSVLYQMDRSPNAKATERVGAILRLLSRLGREGADKALLVQQLRRALNPYLWRFNVSDSTQGVVAFLVSAGGGDAWEAGAVRCALALMEHGQLWRLFECEVCGELGFAPYKEQKFCGDTCKSNHYYSKPENRASKLKKMKDNRDALKKRIEDGKKLIGFTKKSAKKSR